MYRPYNQGSCCTAHVTRCIRVIILGNDFINNGIIACTHHGQIVTNKRRLIDWFVMVHRHLNTYREQPEASAIKIDLNGLIYIRDELSVLNG